MKNNVEIVGFRPRQQERDSLRALAVYGEKNITEVLRDLIPSEGIIEAMFKRDLLLFGEKDNFSFRIIEVCVNTLANEMRHHPLYSISEQVDLAGDNPEEIASLYRLWADAVLARRANVKDPDSYFEEVEEKEGTFRIVLTRGMSSRKVEMLKLQVLDLMEEKSL
jgi:hypothetical protein